MNYSLVAHSAVNVPCNRFMGKACKGCPRCGVGTKLEISDPPATRTGPGGIRLYVEPTDERAFPVEIRGWPA